ncbi:MAG: tape measure protein [Bacteroides xylanisolvens]
MGILNRDGALWMATGIDNSGLYSGLNQAEERVDQFEAHIKRAGDNITRLTGIGFGIMGLKSFGQEVINVTGEMQMLESSFEVLLGGNGVSGFIAELKKFAVDSPLSLTGVSQAAQTLLGFGIAADKVMPTIKQMGDISMGNEEKFKSLSLAFAQMSATGKLMGQDLLQMINAGFNPLMTISEKTGKSIGDLKKDMENGAISSEMVADAFASATAQGGKFYGMTEKQAEGIRGLEAQLEGGLQDAFNNLGKSQEDLITGGYKVAISLVENYETVGKVIIALIATYGVYKAAIVAHNVVLRIQGEMALQTALANTALTTSQQIGAVASRQWSVALATLNKTMLANPSVWLAAAIVALGYGIYELATYQTEAEKGQNRLNDAMGEAEKASIGETRELAKLKGELSAAKKGTEEYNTIKDKIISNYGKYYDGLANEIEKVGLLEGTYNKLTIAIQKSFGARQYDKFLKEESDRLDGTMSENLGKIQDRLIDKMGDEAAAKYYSKIRKAILNGNVSVSTGMDGWKVNGLDKDTQNALDEISGRKNKDWVRNYAIEGYIDNIIKAKRLVDELDEKARVRFGINDAVDDKKREESEKKAETVGERRIRQANELIEAEKKLASMKSKNSTSSDKDIEDQKKVVDDLKKILGKDSSSIRSSESAANKAQQLAENKLEAQRKLDEADKQRQIDKLAFDNDMAQRAIDNMDDGYSKRIAQINLNFQKEQQTIQEYEKKIAKDQQDYAKNQYITKYGNDKGFENYYKTVDLSKIMPESLKPENVKLQVDNLYKAARDANKKGLNDISRDISLSMQDERLRFSDELTQQIADIKAHFAQRKKEVQSGSDEWFELEDLQNKTIEILKARHNTKLVELDNDYKEKSQELTNESYLFQADKDAALLKVRIANNQKYIDAKKKEFKTETGSDFDLLDDAALQSLFKKYPELVQAIKAAKQEQKKLNKELEKTPEEKFKEVLDYVSGITNELSSLDAFSGLDKMSGFFDAAGQFATGDYLGGSMSSLSSIVGLISQAEKDREEARKIQEELNKLQLEYNESLRNQNVELIDSIDYSRIFRDNIEAITYLIEHGFISDMNLSEWDALNKKYEQSKLNLELVIEEQKKYNSEADDFLSFMNARVPGTPQVRQILDDWNNGVIDTLEALKRLRAAGVNGLDTIIDRLEYTSEELAKTTSEVEELRLKLDELFTGISFDDAKSDLQNFLSDVNTTMEDIADNFEKYMRDAIINSLVNNELNKRLQDWYHQFADAMEDGSLSEDEKKNLQELYNQIYKDAVDMRDNAYAAAGIDPNDDSSRESSAKGVATASQDSIEYLTGLWTLSVEHTRSINDNVGFINELTKAISESLRELRSDSGSILESVRNIDKNTQELYVMRQDMAAMKQDINSMVLHGILIKS